MSTISSAHFEGSLFMEVSFELIREKNPYFVILSEDLPRESITTIVEKIKTDRFMDFMAVILISHDFDPVQWQGLIEKRWLDGWIDISEPEISKKFRMNRLYDLVKAQRDLAKMRINNEFLQSEISYYDRKRIYKEGLEQKERTKDLINFMHFVRTYLTGIKGGIDLIFKEQIGEEEKKLATTLVLRNIHKIEEYINEQDFTVKEEKKSKVVQPIILKLRPLLLNIEKQLIYEGRKNSISIFSEFPENDHSILAKTPDMEIIVDSLYKGFLSLVKAGSVVRIGAKLLSSASMIEFYFKVNKDSIDRESMISEINNQKDAVQFLNDKESKFELFEESNLLGMRFYLPRLA